MTWETTEPTPRTVKRKALPAIYGNLLAENLRSGTPSTLRTSYPKLLPRLEKKPHGEPPPSSYYPSFMRILLQNTETKLYFAGPNEWTEDTSKAINFEHIDRASQMYNTENLAYAEIVLKPDLPVDLNEVISRRAIAAEGIMEG